jgi:hypothetical protein
VRLERTTVSLAAGEATIIPFLLTVPHDAEPGDHAGGIVASLSQTADTGEGRVRVDYRVGVRIYLRVAGVLTPRLEMEDVRFDYRQALNPTAGKGTLQFELHNRGNASLGAAQTVRVSGPFGLWSREIAAADATEILPGQSRRLETDLALPPLLRLRAEVIVNPRLARGADVPDPAALTASAAAWAPPYAALGILAVIGTAGGVGVRSFRAHREQARIGGLFAPGAVAPLLRRLNAEHRDDLLSIARRVPGHEAATAAALVTVDPTGCELFVQQAPGSPTMTRVPLIVDGTQVGFTTTESTTPGSPEPVRVSWSRALRSPHEIEAELAALAMGTPPDDAPASAE